MVAVVTRGGRLQGVPSTELWVLWLALTKGDRVNDRWSLQAANCERFDCSLLRLIRIGVKHSRFFGGLSENITQCARLGLQPWLSRCDCMSLHENRKPKPVLSRMLMNLLDLFLCGLFPLNLQVVWKSKRHNVGRCFNYRTHRLDFFAGDGKWVYPPPPKRDRRKRRKK